MNKGFTASVSILLLIFASCTSSKAIRRPARIKLHSRVEEVIENAKYIQSDYANKIDDVKNPLGI